MTDKQKHAIERHGRNLQAIFPACANIDPVELCCRLRRIEIVANDAATEYCNGQAYQFDIDRRGAAALNKLDGLIGFRAAKVPVFFNRDPRGYALKIDDGYMRAHDVVLHRDMGGYGIIAPEIDKNGE